jgi:cytochrome c
LRNADIAAGETVARRCASCHGFRPEDPNRVGPALYDVVGRVIGSHEGYRYSAALLAMRDAGSTWSYENLDAFIASPKSFAPGTRMSFTGIPGAQDRANLLGYMQTLSSDPKPFPAE